MCLGKKINEKVVLLMQQYKEVPAQQIFCLHTAGETQVDFVHSHNGSVPISVPVTVTANQRAHLQELL